MKSLLISTSIVVLAFCGSVFAQTTKPLTATEQAAKELADKIASSDSAVRSAAVDEIRQQMEDPRNNIAVYPLKLCLSAMAKAGLHDEVVEFTMQAVLRAPADCSQLQTLHRPRIQALLALKREEEALAEAKSLYNVSDMKGTSEALLLIAQCMKAAHPEDKA